MKFNISVIYIVLLCLIVSCNNEKDADNKSNNESESQENTSSFSYSYDHSSTEVSWTAFKHSTKAPVSGKFDSITVEGFIESHIITEALKNVSFSLFTSSTNTQDKERDLKIITNFFGNMINPFIITGKILKIKGNKNGKGKVLLKMNNTEKTILFNWEIDENDEFFLTADLNILDWGVEVAFDILNTVCSEKHTGIDGEKKLWPDVKVTVLTNFKRK